MLITTQNIEEAEHLADKICIMKNGENFKFDTPANLKRDACYGFRLEIVPKNRRFAGEKDELKSFIQARIKGAYEEKPPQ